MRILGVDTTRDALTVVITDGKETRFIVSEEGNKKHTSLLIPKIEELLTANGLSLSDANAFSAVTGPGSFTGIRVGISTINALSYATGKPCIDVNSFELVAYNKGEGTVLIDALHGNYYGASVKDGKVLSMRYYEKGDEIPGERFYRDEQDDYVEAFAYILNEKAAGREFTNSLVPLYLRESQAEREARKNG